MKNYSLKLTTLLIAITFGAACSSASDALLGVNVAVANGIVAEEMYRLTGQGNYSGDVREPDLVVNAVRTFSGEIKGNVIVPRDGTGKLGSVIGIVPPSVSYNYWCVAVALDDQPDLTLLIYIKDVPSGVDAISLSGGPGATCEASLTPFEVWADLVTGNFTGTVKIK